MGIKWDMASKLVTDEDREKLKAEVKSFYTQIHDLAKEKYPDRVAVFILACYNGFMYYTAGMLSPKAEEEAIEAAATIMKAELQEKYHDSIDTSPLKVN